MAEEVDGGELVAVVEAAAVVELTELEKRARSFARDSRATSTWRAYDSDFADLRNWCTEQQPAVEALPVWLSRVVRQPDQRSNAARRAPSSRPNVVASTRPCCGPTQAR